MEKNATMEKIAGADFEPPRIVGRQQQQIQDRRTTFDEIVSKHLCDRRNKTADEDRRTHDDLFIPLVSH